MTEFNGIKGEEKVVVWIKDGINAEAISYAEDFGRHLVKPKVRKKDGKEINDPSQALTTSQIRNFFGEVTRMKMKGYMETDFLLLKPRLAYATQRNGTEGSKDFKIVFDKAIDSVVDGIDKKIKEQRFRNFLSFFEAVLAYHRSFGGK